MKYTIVGGVILAAVILFVVFNLEMFIPKEEKIQEKKVTVEEKAPVVEVKKKETATVKEPEMKAVYRKKIAPTVSIPEEKPATLVVSRTTKKKKLSSYERLTAEVKIFFDYLDSRDYVKAYRLSGGSQKHFLTLLATLSQNPPVISGETRDIYTLTHNMAHFYRIMGKDTISLGKEILSKEREIIEPAAEMLYLWIFEAMKRHNGDVKTSLQQLYEYASFFMNTLSGKAYLARRNSQTRILLTYYSLLIMDKANRGSLNHHGIDILPPLNLLMDDIENQRGLEYRGKYLTKLRHIKGRTIVNREKGVLKY